MKWGLLFAPMLLAGFALGRVIGESSSEHTLQLSAPCPPVPATVGIVIRAMSAPSFRFDPAFTDDQIQRFVEACTSVSDEQMRAACATHYGKVAVDFEAWPPRCEQVDIIRSDGRPLVEWYPKGCEK